MPIRVSGTTIAITTSRLSATFDGAHLIELRDPRGRVLARPTGKRIPALTLGFINGESTPLGVAAYSQTSVTRLGSRVVHVHVADENGDACLRLAIDDQDRLVIEPSAQTIRRGLVSISWCLPGIAKRLRLVASFFQGCRQDLEHPLIAGKHWEWPNRWEAAVAILQGAADGFSVSTYDRRNQPKALRVGAGATARSLGLESSVHGPALDTIAVGSLQWVIDTHDGDWQVPAGRYREWLHAEVGAARLLAARPAWARDIRLALQWCGNNQEILDAVAKVIDPAKVLIHQAAWRADAYDVNYPEYRASRDGAAFLRKARAMGFRVMPHFNSIAIDPNHPAFARMIDVVARQFGSRRLMAWRWKDGHCPQPPQAHGCLADLRDEKLMYYLHPGASSWRRLLAERITAAAARHKLSTVFVDQTLCTWNLDNAILENQTMAEGMVALTRELTELDGPLAVGGEGLNEMSMRHQTFAQAHLFESWHHNTQHFDALDPVPVGDFLYGDLCRTMGYTNLAGETAESIRRLEVHEMLGALPSLTVGKPKDVLAPNRAVRRVLERATS